MAGVADDNVKNPDTNSSDNDNSQDAPSAMECPICLQPCMHPVELPCRHVFCFLCIKGVAIQGPNGRCAICRAAIPHNVLTHPQLKDISQLYKDQKAANGYQWFYESRSGGWWQYDERTMNDLEREFSSNKPNCQLLLAGHLYVVDFQQMIQYRSNNRNVSRRIRRELNIEGSQKRGVAGIRLAGSGTGGTGSSGGGGGGGPNNGPSPPPNNNQGSAGSNPPRRRRGNAAAGPTSSSGAQSAGVATSSAASSAASSAGGGGGGDGPPLHVADLSDSDDASVEEDEDYDSDYSDADEDMELGEEEEAIIVEDSDEEETEDEDEYEARDGARAPTRRSDRSNSSNNQTPPPPSGTGFTTNGASSSGSRTYSPNSNGRGSRSTRSGRSSGGSRSNNSGSNGTSSRSVGVPSSSSTGSDPSTVSPASSNVLFLANTNSRFTNNMCDDNGLMMRNINMSNNAIYLPPIDPQQIIKQVSVSALASSTATIKITYESNGITHLGREEYL